MDLITATNDSSKGLFLIFLAIICNFLADVMNCSVQKVLYERPILKWLVIFFLIYFTINFTSDPKASPFILFGISAFIFLMFILFMKQNNITFFIALVLLIVVFTLNQWISHYKALESLDHEQTIKRLEKSCFAFQIVLFTVLIIGTGIYFSYQYEAHRKDFQINRFFFGTEPCSSLKKTNQQQSGIQLIKKHQQTTRQITEDTNLV